MNVPDPPLEDLRRDERLWPLINTLLAAGSMTATLEDCLGYRPLMHVIDAGVHPVPTSLASALHCGSDEPAQNRNIRFEACDGTTVATARAFVLVGRLPWDIRTQLETTETPLGRALRPLGPCRHVLRWKVVAGKGTHAKRLRITVRLDVENVPLAWVSETLHLDVLADPPDEPSDIRESSRHGTACACDDRGVRREHRG